MKLVNDNVMIDFSIQMHLQLISIPGCDGSSFTISIWSFSEARMRGVLLNGSIQLYKRFTSDMLWDD